MTTTTTEQINGDLGRKVLKYAEGKPQFKAAVDSYVERKVGFASLGDLVAARGGEYDASDKAALRTVLLALCDDMPHLLEPGASKPVDRGDLAGESGPRPIEVAATVTVEPPAKVAAPMPVPAGGDPGALIAAAIAAIARQNAPEAKAQIDPAAIEKAAVEAAKAQGEAVKAEVMEAIAAAMKDIEAMAQRMGVRTLEIITETATRRVEGVTHWQFPQVLAWVGAGVPLWLWGAAGNGKTHMARQVAEALGLKPTVISVDPTMTVGKLLGFPNLATGAFVEGFLYRPFKEGGLVLVDEIDIGDPGILAALNALIANGHYCFPNGETVERHKDFRIMAGANTKGCGAVAGYTARNRLDAATLNRFAVVELQYDEHMEMLLGAGIDDGARVEWKAGEKITSNERLQKWVLWVQSVRKQVGTRVLVSPRASYLGCAALRSGIKVEEVADALVFALVDSDTKRNIINYCGGVPQV